MTHNSQAFVQSRTRDHNIVTQVDDIIDDDSLGNLFGVARSSKPKARTIDDILQDSSDDEIDKSYFKKKRKQSIIVESKKSHECTDKGNL